jgi:hypothetical protein
MPALHETRKAVIEAMRLIMTDQEQRLAATHATLKELQGRAENQVRHEFAYTVRGGAAASKPGVLPAGGGFAESARPPVCSGRPVERAAARPDTSSGSGLSLPLAFGMNTRLIGCWSCSAG